MLLTTTTASAQTTFTDVTAGDLNTSLGSYSVSWIDVDDDDDLDLFAAALTGSGHKLFINEEGDLSLADVPAFSGERYVRGHCWGDVDNDGDPDLVTVGRQDNQPTASPSLLYRNEGNGSFSQVESGALAPTADIRGWSCAWADYDADGNLDLAVAHAAGYSGDPDQTNHLFRGNGDVTFATDTSTPITEGLDTYTVPTWSDYDLDGDPDLFIGSGPADGSVDEDNLYKNMLAETGSAAFERITAEPIATDERDGQVMNWVDIDNDSDLDLFVTNYWGGDGDFTAFVPEDLYRNDGGTYVRVTEGPLVTNTDGGFALANTWGDIDNDGDLDVFVTTGGPSYRDRLYLNDGAGNFELDWQTPRKPTAGASFGDYDADGDLDLAVTTVFTSQSGAARLELWRNDLGAENHWVQLKLVGTTSNRSAIGAKVWATAMIGGEEVTQLREVSSQNTFGGQNSPLVHFGFGNAGVIESLRIAWPSGAVETFDDVVPDRLLIATEGEGLFAVASEQGATPPANMDAGIEAVYPNPASDGITITFELASGGPAILHVYDVLGRSVRSLDMGSQPAGEGKMHWDGRSASGARLPAGTYVLRLEVGGRSYVRRVSLLVR